VRDLAPLEPHDERVGEGAGRGAVGGAAARIVVDDVDEARRARGGQQARPAREHVDEARYVDDVGAGERVARGRQRAPRRQQRVEVDVVAARQRTRSARERRCACLTVQDGASHGRTLAAKRRRRRPRRRRALSTRARRVTT